jgi:hypothetical protein
MAVRGSFAFETPSALQLRWGILPVFFLCTALIGALISIPARTDYVRRACSLAADIAPTVARGPLFPALDAEFVGVDLPRDEDCSSVFRARGLRVLPGSAGMIGVRFFRAEFQDATHATIVVDHLCGPDCGDRALVSAELRDGRWIVTRPHNL